MFRSPLLIRKRGALVTRSDTEHDVGMSMIRWESPYAALEAAFEEEPVPTLRSNPGSWALISTDEPLKGLPKRQPWIAHPNIETHQKTVSTYEGGATRTVDLYAKWKPTGYEKLMTRDQVAAQLGIDPESVRSTMRRHDITEQRGYPHDQVLALFRSRSMVTGSVLSSEAP